MWKHLLLCKLPRQSKHAFLLLGQPRAAAAVCRGYGRRGQEPSAAGQAAGRLSKRTLGPLVCIGPCSCNSSKAPTAQDGHLVQHEVPRNKD